ncbi:MAG: hypothetical protein IJV06_01370 [Bacteroidaceae bacterium]|nr:hypothetical protein [Bacteroidaceae bacterium]
MRKFLLLAVLASACVAAQAQDETTTGQKIGSQSEIVNKKIIVEPPKPKKPKKPRKFRWNVRAGYSIDQLTGVSNELSSTSGFDAGLGVVFPIGNKGFFLDTEVGAVSFRAKIKEGKGGGLGVSIHLSPTLGFKFPLAKNLAIAPYIGPYISFNVVSSHHHIYPGYNIYRKGNQESSYLSDWDYHESLQQNKEVWADNLLDAGINVGVKFFLSKKFYIDIHCRKGFVNFAEYESETSHSIYRKEEKTGIRAGQPYTYMSDLPTEYLPDDGNIEYKKLSTLKIVFGLGFQF